MLGKPLSMIFSLDSGENRGMYYEDTQRAIIYVRQHETLPDLYKTMTHKHKKLLIWCGLILWGLFILKDYI